MLFHAVAQHKRGDGRAKDIPLPGAPVYGVHISGWGLDLVLGAVLEVYPPVRFLTLFLNGFTNFWPFNGANHVGKVEVEDIKGLEDAGGT